jgi:hypothetical protein
MSVRGTGRGIIQSCQIESCTQLTTKVDVAQFMTLRRPSQWSRRPDSDRSGTALLTRLSIWSMAVRHPCGELVAFPQILDVRQETIITTRGPSSPKFGVTHRFEGRIVASDPLSKLSDFGVVRVKRGKRLASMGSQ